MDPSEKALDSKKVELDIDSVGSKKVELGIDSVGVDQIMKGAPPVEDQMDCTAVPEHQSSVNFGAVVSDEASKVNTRSGKIILNKENDVIPVEDAMSSTDDTGRVSPDLEIVYSSKPDEPVKKKSKVTDERTSSDVDHMNWMAITQHQSSNDLLNSLVEAAISNKASNMDSLSEQPKAVVANKRTETVNPQQEKECLKKDCTVVPKQQSSLNFGAEVEVNPAQKETESLKPAENANVDDSDDDVQLVQQFDYSLDGDCQF